jgi:hypothetical protein
MATVTSKNREEFIKKEMDRKAGKGESPKESREKRKDKVDMESWMKKYRENEDKNYHSENVIRLANLVGHIPHHEEAMEIHERHMNRGHLSPEDYERRQAIHKEHYPTAEKMYQEWAAGKEKEAY